MSIWQQTRKRSRTQTDRNRWTLRGAGLEIAFVGQHVGGKMND